MKVVRPGPRSGSQSRRGPLGRFLRLFAGSADWHPASTAPFNRDVEVRVAGDRGARVLPFPCRQTADGWINVLPYSRANYEALFSAGGRSDLIGDPRYQTVSAIPCIGITISMESSEHQKEDYES